MAGLSRTALRTAAAALTAAVLAATVAPSLSGSGEIRVVIDRGRVTLSVLDAPLADVLAAWSRAGGTRFLGAEPLGGERITLHLVDAPEADAIRLLLRPAAGYVAAPRRDRTAGPSRFDRVTVLAARSAPAGQTFRSAGGTGSRRVARPPTPAGAAALPTLVPLEELQRLLDAAANPSGDAVPAEPPPEVPVRTTPVPGVTRRSS